MKKKIKIKKLKKLGYGISIHYSELSETFSVFKTGEWSPSARTSNTNTRFVENKSLSKAIKKYSKRYL